MIYQGKLTSMLLFSLAIVRLLCLSGMTVFAKEIEATDEWTLLGENDTVAAGMHVRIDMTTGEKWVKLNSDDDVDDESKKAAPVNAEITADGGLVLVDEKETTADDEEANYDFEMMHRTLSGLPEDEKEEMDLPSLPGGSVESLPKKERVEFELKMTEIWQKRQEQLRKITEESVADMPEILKDRINRIHDYIQNPVTHLQSHDFEEDDGGDQVTHIVSVLEDLEYQLTDVDMARDFFTMGGWPLLLSLIAEETHGSFSASSDNATLTDAILAKIYRVQGYSAWVVGTSVKNVGEFTPFATTKVLLAGGKPDSMVTSAVDLILDSYKQALQVQTPSDEVARSLEFKRQKFLYCLGALLRANRGAQTQFTSSGGPSVLGDVLKASFDGSKVGTPKLKKSLLALADDIASDLKLHPGKSSQVDEAILSAFSSSSWCDAIMLGLEGNSLLQEKALRTARALLSKCAWNPDEFRKALIKLRSAWEERSDDWDEDVMKELLVMIDSTVEMIS